jgi:ankyrin repeat protein
VFELFLIFSHFSSALLWALSGCHMDLCELLVEYGIDMNLPDIHNLCPIHYAVMRKDRDLCALEFLLQNGVDIYATSGRGETALAIARKSGRTAAADMLKEYGARK